MAHDGWKDSETGIKLLGLGVKSIRSIIEEDQVLNAEKDLHWSLKASKETYFSLEKLDIFISPILKSQLWIYQACFTRVRKGSANINHGCYNELKIQFVSFPSQSVDRKNH